MKTGGMKSKIPWEIIFIAGFFFGILLVGVSREYGLLGESISEISMLCKIREEQVGRQSFFYYLVRKRFGQILFLTVASSTYLGVLLCLGAIFLLGFTGGIFLASRVVLYGVKGVALVAVSLFPQYLVYFPGYYLLCVWCERMREASYQKRVSKKEPNPTLILQILLIWIAFLVGCVLECYINVPILQTFLKIF